MHGHNKSVSLLQDCNMSGLFLINKRKKRMKERERREEERGMERGEREEMTSEKG